MQTSTEMEVEAATMDKEVGNDNRFLLLVLNAAVKILFLSNQEAIGQFFAETALESSEDKFPSANWLCQPAD